MDLRRITPENYRAVLALTVKADQRGFVAPTVDSLAEAYTLRLSVVPENDRARRLYADAGFVETGELDHGETVMVLRLADRA